MKICPKCNTTYLSGNTCVDCGEELVEYREVLKKINEKGIHLIKFGIKLIFLTIFEVIAAVIAYDFYWTYKLTHGGVAGTAISNVNPIIWFSIALELVVSFIFVWWGTSCKDAIEE